MRLLIVNNYSTLYKIYKNKQLDSSQPVKCTTMIAKCLSYQVFLLVH